ncbi:hypothetical protein ACFE04_003441 [Oxalis oulophora]
MAKFDESIRLLLLFVVDDDNPKACFSIHSQWPPKSFRLARLESLCCFILPWMSETLSLITVLFVVDDDNPKACFSIHSQWLPKSFRLARLESLCCFILPWMSETSNLFIIGRLRAFALPGLRANAALSFLGLSFCLAGLESFCLAGLES